MSDLSNKPRIWAYYLPQFHPIKENNMWWGEGFTEWTNVASAIPLYKGHKQPRIPTELGFYDLRIPEIRMAQAELAKEAGVEGFIYWNYYFGGGRRLLDMPINEVIKTGEPNFPFCFGWANHSWSSKSWDRIKSLKKDQLLIEQTYPGHQDNIDHFYSLLPAFQDKRYMTVDGKLAFLIYDPFAIPNIKSFFDTWNELAIKNGFSGFFFIGRNNGWSNEIDKQLELGFDCVNRNGQWEAECLVKGKINRSIRTKINEHYSKGILDKYDYSKIIKNIFNEYDTREKVIPTIIPQWDRSARGGKRAVIYSNSTPEKFGLHVDDAFSLVKNKKKNTILVLKSWNEWGEGNYMEPDKLNGRGYINILREKLNSF